MAHYVYIIESDSANRFYVGESEDPDVRVTMHNSHKFKGASTTISSDWKLYLTIKCRNRVVARRIEKHMKAMKSVKYLRNLHQYPEMIDKLIARYDL